MSLKYVAYILILVALVGCSGAQDGGESDSTVSIREFSYTPRTITVTEGTTVTWINEGRATHTVTSDDDLFDSGRLRPGQMFNFTFDDPGTYPYHCSLHLVMEGTVEVTEAPEPERPAPVRPEPEPEEPEIEEPEPERPVEPPRRPQIPPEIELPEIEMPQVQVPQTVIQYSQFYRVVPEAEVEEISAERLDIRGQEPARVYFGGLQGPEVSYTEYATLATGAGPNTLWIQGRDAWVRYAAVPQGSSLNLVAITASQGTGTVYEIHPSGRLIRNQLYFYPYSYIGFYADVTGQHILLFVKDNVPSNAVVIDVVRYQPVPQPVAGTATVNIVSDYITGYDVYVDGYYRLTEGQGGIPDGYSSFRVSGNADHEITIRRAGFSYTYSRYFQAGGSYTIRLGQSQS